MQLPRRTARRPPRCPSLRRLPPCSRRPRRPASTIPIPRADRPRSSATTLPTCGTRAMAPASLRGRAHATRRPLRPRRAHRRRPRARAPARAAARRDDPHGRRQGHPGALPDGDLRLPARARPRRLRGPGRPSRHRRDAAHLGLPPEERERVHRKVPRQAALRRARGRHRGLQAERRHHVERPEGLRRPDRRRHVRTRPRRPPPRRRRPSGLCTRSSATPPTAASST